MNTYTITDTAGTTARRVTAHDATGAARVVLGDVEATPVLVKVIPVGTRVIATRFDLDGNTSVSVTTTGTVIGSAGDLAYLVRFDGDHAERGVFPSEIERL